MSHAEQYQMPERIQKAERCKHTLQGASKEIRLVRISAFMQRNAQMGKHKGSLEM